MHNVTDIADESMFDAPIGNELLACNIETQWLEGVREHSFNHRSMFHIVSFQNVSTTSVDVDTSSTNNLKIQVWTLKGSYVYHTDSEDD